MKYLLLICWDPTVEDPGGPGIEAWFGEMRARRVHLDGQRLRPISDATTVRRRDGELLITDGPFAETKEQIAGYDIIDAADLDEAIEVASKHPMTRAGSVEVRPFWPMD
jgi:hypothetical protein